MTETEEKPLTEPQEPAELSKQIDDIRRRAKRLFINLINEPKSMFSPGLVAEFLSVSYRTLYRWKAFDLWLPTFAMAQEIVSFITDVELTRKTWRGVVEQWPGSEFSKAPADILAVVFNRKILEVLQGRLIDSQGRGLSDTEKVEELTVRTLKLHVERRKRREEMATVLSLAPDWKTPPTKDEEV